MVDVKPPQRKIMPEKPAFWRMAPAAPHGTRTRKKPSCRKILTLCKDPFPALLPRAEPRPAQGRHKGEGPRPAGHDSRSAHRSGRFASPAFPLREHLRRLAVRGPRRTLPHRFFPSAVQEASPPTSAALPACKTQASPSAPSPFCLPARGVGALLFAPPSSRLRALSAFRKRLPAPSGKNPHLTTPPEMNASSPSPSRRVLLPTPGTSSPRLRVLPLRQMRKAPSRPLPSPSQRPVPVFSIRKGRPCPAAEAALKSGKKAAYLSTPTSL